MAVKFVVWHKDRGFYLGHCIGLGFWSEWESAGQESAVIFESKDDFLDYVCEIDNKDAFDGSDLIPVTVHDDDTHIHRDDLEIQTGKKVWCLDEG